MVTLGTNYMVNLLVNLMVTINCSPVVIFDIITHQDLERIQR